MGVGRPGVGTLDACAKARDGARAQSPNAPSTCTQASGRRARALRDRRRHRYSRCRPAYGRSTVRTSPETRRRASAPARRPARAPHARARDRENPEIEHTQMRFLADHDCERRRPEQAVGFDIPAATPRAWRAAASARSSRRWRRSRRRRRRSHVAGERVEQPAQRNLLEPCRCGRDVVTVTRIITSRDAQASSLRAPTAANRR